MSIINHVNFLPYLALTTVAIAVVGILMIMSSIIVFAHADSINPGVYPIDSKPFDISYAEWTARWFQWLISMPQQTNAAADPTGKFCAVNQNGPVWFLAGTTGGSAERTCTIPAGKAILFPVVNSECSYVENPSVKTEFDLISCAKQDNNRATNLQATIDGQKLQQLDRYRVVSPLVDVTFPDNNLFGTTPGKSKMIVDGFYVFLQPLSKGNHELHFSSFTPPASPGGSNYVIDVTYHLKVQ